VRVLGDHHHDTLTSMNNLAELRRQLENRRQSAMVLS